MYAFVNLYDIPFLRIIQPCIVRTNNKHNQCTKSITILRNVWSQYLQIVARILRTTTFIASNVKFMRASLSHATWIRIRHISSTHDQSQEPVNTRHIVWNLPEYVQIWYYSSISTIYRGAWCLWTCLAMVLRLRTRIKRRVGRSLWIGKIFVLYHVRILYMQIEDKHARGCLVFIYLFIHSFI